METLSGLTEFEARIVPIGPDEVISVARDVTDRKQIEEQIKRQNRDLTLLNRVISAAGEHARHQRTVDDHLPRVSAGV